MHLLPLVVRVEVGVAAAHHTRLVALGLDVAVRRGAGQPGRGERVLRVVVKFSQTQFS